MRYFSPVLFLGAGAVVLWYDASHADSVLYLPFIDVVFPSTAGDLRAQGRASGWVLAGVGVALLLMAIRGHLRERTERADDEVG